MTKRLSLLLFPLVLLAARVRDDFSGTMESDGGLKRLVDDVRRVMEREKIVKSAGVHGIVISANEEHYRNWLLSGSGRIGKSLSRLIRGSSHGNAPLAEGV